MQLLQIQFIAPCFSFMHFLTDLTFPAHNFSSSPGFLCVGSKLFFWYDQISECICIRNLLRMKIWIYSYSKFYTNKYAKNSSTHLLWIFKYIHLKCFIWANIQIHLYQVFLYEWISKYIFLWMNSLTFIRFHQYISWFPTDYNPDSIFDHVIKNISMNKIENAVLNNLHKIGKKMV